MLVGADGQGHQESYIEIHQQYPIKSANSCNIKNNEYGMPKICMKLDKFHK